ncbi:hypothetical protein [Breoghania sp.]|uniref:hypothetical protein n=1 Tax=Breoghania sp. TaxID=2065378 RepID=UPI002621960F|nr:hypothetical protein [Breoghania sp.]MDJ0932659.1 hypothetical protein [Breoghania sp.]
MAIVLMVRPWGLLGREEKFGEHGQVGDPQRPIRPAGPRGRILALALIAVLALVPAFTSSFAQVLLTDILIFCLFASSLQFILSTGGLISFGHAVFFGGGAYASALLVTYFDTPMELAFMLAPLGAGILAIGIG